MRVHINQHLAHEHAAGILEWAKNRNHFVSHTYLFEEQFSFPPVDHFDLLVVLGGTMGAYEEEKFSWLRDEKNFIRHAIDSGKTVLGICLGSQILADVLGSNVYPHDKKEIGFFPVYKTPAAERDTTLSSIPNEWMVFHWHGDTFDLPPGADHLFFSDACKNQGFRKGKCFGLQFHGEATNSLLHSMIDDQRAELIKTNHVQSETEILSYCHPDDNLKIFDVLLDRVAELT